MRKLLRTSPLAGLHLWVHVSLLRLTRRATPQLLAPAFAAAIDTYIKEVRRLRDLNQKRIRRAERRARELDTTPKSTPWEGSVSC